jgi:hypothetical protein
LTEKKVLSIEEKLAKFLIENGPELSTLSKEDRDLAIFQEGYIAGLERGVDILTAPKTS